MTKHGKIGIVVHRCHPSIVGGSESLAWKYATMLKGHFELEILTTTAADSLRWANKLPDGMDRYDGVNVRRFPVERQRDDYWNSLHARLIADVDRARANGSGLVSYRDGWTIGLQREFIDKQGPYSPSLRRFIRDNHRAYSSLIFITYLYPTTYFGVEAASHHPDKILVPTLHDEAPAYLSAYRAMARNCNLMFWNSTVERDLGVSLWGNLPGIVLGMPIDCALAEKKPGSPFLLYSGRIDRQKGCGEMFNYFREFKNRHPSDLRLQLTGVASMEIPQRPDIEFLGFVSEEEKKFLMRNAIALVMPSVNESFSIVTLEAMAQGTPVIGTAEGSVVAAHVRASGGGMLFRDAETFVSSLSALIRNKNQTEEMGSYGRKYVAEHYSESIIRQRLLQLLEDRASQTCAG